MKPQKNVFSLKKGKKIASVTSDDDAGYIEL